MTEVIIQLPQDIATRLAPIQQHLPQLLSQIAQAVPADRPEELTAQFVATHPVYNEFLNFLMTGPSPQSL